MDVVARADAFAEEAHRGQVRKYTGEPYIVHPRAVATTVARFDTTPNMIVAALLHDVVEDCPVSISDIRKVFGVWVANLVDMLTDVSRPEDGNRAIRKALDREHLAKAHYDAQTIKIADLIDNAASIVTHDIQFAKIYLPEKRLLLGVLKNGHPGLASEAWRVLEDSERQLASS